MMKTGSVGILAWVVFALAGCGGGGGNGGNPVVVAQPATITGTVAGTIVVATNASGEIIASSDTTGTAADANGHFSFSLASIPLNQNVRVYLISHGAIYPLYFDSDGNGTFDANVFALDGATNLNLGFVDVANANAQGKAVPGSNPTSNDAFVSAGVDAAIPNGINSPPTGDLSLADLLQNAISALENGWVMGARTYLDAAVTMSDGSTSNDADTARFLFALTRIASVAADTLSDGDSSLDKVGDILDRLDVPNDETRENVHLLALPKPLPSTTPTGNEIRDFLYNVVRPELNGAVENLDAISPSFNAVWSDPKNESKTEVDYSDVLAIRGAIKTVLAAIATQRAYDLSGDVAAAATLHTTIEAFLADNPTVLSLADPTKLAEAKGYLVGSAIDDFKAAVDAINAETDDQSDDLITLASTKDPTGTQAKAALDQVAASLVNGSGPVGSATLDLKEFFDVGVDFRTPNRLPPFAGNHASGLFPDPTFAGVVTSPDLNADVKPADGVPDILQ